jgi:hypothetical protein
VFALDLGELLDLRGDRMDKNVLLLGHFVNKNYFFKNPYS